MGEALVDPVLHKRKQAAGRLGCSLTTLDSMRADDRARLARGEPIRGPRWLMMPYGLRYLDGDLIDYIERNAIMVGKMESRSRKQGARVV